MATINNDFKVKNGLVVGTTATILSTTTSVSSTTGALIVSGGVGVANDVNVGGTFVSQGYDLMAYDGSVHYVSDVIGNDSNDGHRKFSAFKTVKHALSVAQSGDTVFIETGRYTEIFPLTIPQGVAVKGAGLREVIVSPTTATNTQTAMLLNGETSISDFTLSGFYKPGYAFAFAPGAKITSKSPYVERFSVITRGSITSSSDPYGFNAADAGNGAYLDAGVLDPTSLEPAMLWNEATFIVPNATGMYMTNGARAELLNGFFYFADKAIDAQAGITGYGGVGKTKLKLSGVSNTFTAGDTIIYKDPSGTILASGTINSVDGSYVYLAGPVWGFEASSDRTSKAVLAYGDAKQSNAAVKYGTSSAIFDGNGDYLEILNDIDFQFGSGAYTIEAWINLSAVGKTNRIFYKGTTSGSSIRLSVSSGNVLQAFHGGSIITGSTVLTTGVWYHVALSHSVSGNLKIFLNGVSEASATGVITNINNTDPVDIGGIPATPTDSLNGYIDDLRVSNNYRYSTTFSVPTAGLGSDANTVLLLNMNGGNGTNVFVDSNLGTQNVYSTGAHPATATRIELADYHQFGAELRCIGSAAVFGNSGITANGTGTDLKLIAFNMSHIGSGKDLSDDISLTNQPNEVIQTNGGKVYYQTVDHNGDFRVGDSFLVNQRTGNVSFGNAQVNLSNLNSLVITDGVHSTTILPTGIETGNLSLAGNTVASLSGNITIDPAGNLTTINSDTIINGSTVISSTENSMSTSSGALVVNGGIGVGGNLWVGGTMYGAFSGSLTGVATTATDLFGGSAGQVPYQSGFSQTTFAGTGTAGEVFVSRGVAGPQFQNTLTLSSSLYSTSTTSSNALYVVGGIGAGWINIANDAYINGAAIVTTATLGTATGSSSFNIQNTGSNAFTVAGGAVIGGNLTIGGNVQFSGTVTSINSTAVDIGSKIIYLSTLSSTASYAYGSGIIIGSDPDNSTTTVRWASLTFDGGIPGNWVIGNGLLPDLNNIHDLGSDSFKWATVYASTVTAAKVYDNNNRVITSVTPSAGTAIGIGGLTSTGPSASFIIDNLGVTRAEGSTYIGVSTSTGSISITNLGVTNLNGSTYIGISANTGTVTLTNLGVTNLSSGSDITLSATTGSITINDISTFESVTNRGATSNNAITLTNTTISTGTTTGALTVAGGVGIQGSLYAGTMFSNGNQVLTSGAGGSGYVSSIIAGTDISVNTSTGAVTVSDISTLQSVSGRGATTTNIIFISTATNASSTNSGALQVAGGVGVGKDVVVGGQVVTSVLTSTGGMSISTGPGAGNFLSISNNGFNTVFNPGGTIQPGGAIVGSTFAATSVDVTQNTLLLKSPYYGAQIITGAAGPSGTLYTWSFGTDGQLTNPGNVVIQSTVDSTSTNSGALTVAGGVGIGGTVHIANTSYIGTGTILTSVDLQTVTYNAAYLTNDPTSVPGLVAIAGTSTSYGTYNFGTVTDIQTFNDYNTATNTGFYSINDATGAPGALTYIGFTGVTDFNRFVLNINYTASSGHTQDIDLYNWVTQAWDTFTTYSGSTNWFQFIEGVINPAPYISSGKVWSRIYHASAGNTAHRTWIDYAALEKSIQGGQGPRGATGATGAQGPQGLTTTTSSTFIFSNATASTGTNSGAVVVYGGVGVGGSMYIGNTSYINGSPILTAATLAGSGVSSITAGTDTAVSTSTGAVTIWDTSTLQSVTSRGATSNNPISLTSTLSVSSQTTLGAVTATSIVVNGTVQHNGLVLTEGLNVDQIYTTSTTITLSTDWQDTGVDSAELATGSYMVQCTANDSGVGGNEVNTYYTGIMSWYSGGDTENSYDEITLHRAGAASGSGSIFLQVLRTSGGYMKLQIAGTTNNSAPSTYALKFRRMI